MGQHSLEYERREPVMWRRSRRAKIDRPIIGSIAVAIFGAVSAGILWGLWHVWLWVIGR